MSRTIALEHADEDREMPVDDFDDDDPDDFFNDDDDDQQPDQEEPEGYWNAPIKAKAGTAAPKRATQTLHH